MLLGRRRLRDLGPLDWFALAIGCLAVVMNLVALFGWRLWGAQPPARSPLSERATRSTSWWRTFT
jgi:hypothetical protein